jgi:hypothetical protein
MPPSSRPPEDCVPGTSRTGSLVEVVFDDPMFPDGAVCLGILESSSASIVADKRGADAMVYVCESILEYALTPPCA